MQKFLSLLFSRRALAVVGVLVLALLVWFVGPLVSFDTLRPLASVGSRVIKLSGAMGQLSLRRQLSEKITVLVQVSGHAAYG